MRQFYPTFITTPPFQANMPANKRLEKGWRKQYSKVLKELEQGFNST
jgi:hypothetical protein